MINTQTTKGVKAEIGFIGFYACQLFVSEVFHNASSDKQIDAISI